MKGDTALDIENGVGLFQRPNEANVACTRAMARFIVIGNPDLMAKDPYWKQYLYFFQRTGLWQGEKKRLFIPSLCAGSPRMLAPKPIGSKESRMEFHLVSRLELDCVMNEKFSKFTLEL